MDTFLSVCLCVCVCACVCIRWSRRGPVSHLGGRSGPCRELGGDRGIVRALGLTSPEACRDTWRGGMEGAREEDLWKSHGPTGWLCAKQLSFLRGMRTPISQQTQRCGIVCVCQWVCVRGTAYSTHSCVEKRRDICRTYTVPLQFFYDFTYN